MVWMCLLLIAVGFAVSLPVTWVMIRVGHRYGAMDSLGARGHVKSARRLIPNTGGVAIFAAVALPVIAGLAAVHGLPDEMLTRLAPSLGAHLAGIRRETPLAMILVACVAVLHGMGLIDDRRPLGPWVKLVT